MDLYEQAVRNLIGDFGEGAWDLFDEAVKKKMIDKEVDIIKREVELERREAEHAEEKADFVAQSQLFLEEKEDFERQNQDYEHYVKHALTVDDGTPTLEELGYTRSRDVIATSREYIGPVREDHDKLKAGDITFEEAQRKKEILLKRLVREQDARRQRERRASGKTIKTQVERDVSRMATKATDNLSMSIDEFKDKVPIEYKDVVLIVPSQQEIERVVASQAERCLESAGNLDYLIHGNSFTMQIVGESVFNSWLPARCIVNSDGSFHDGWWEWFVNEIEQRVARVVDSDNYEVKDKQLRVVSLGMHYYLQRIECVDNWSFGNRRVTRIMKFKDFRMFTANDLSKNCQRQIVEYFGEVWDESKKLEQMLAPRKVIKGHPGHKRIDQIDAYSDLTWDYHEDVATTDCTNIVRIVEYNAHVGVITLINRRPPPLKKIMKRLPYTTPKDETIPIFVDIEAFESPQPGKYKVQVPYLICWTWPRDDVDGGYEVVHETGPGCVEKFVIRLLEAYSFEEKDGVDNNAPVELCLYAWYGSGYDYQHIYKYLKDRCEDDTTYVRNNSIIYAKFNMGNKLTIHLKDPFLFILCSLDKAAKAFGVLNKGAFPHEVVKDWGDLDRVIREWYVVRRSTAETVEGKTILVTANNWNKVIEIDNTSTVLQKAIEYCTVDVLAMRQVWTKFCNLVQQHLSVKISPKIFTLSQLSMKIMMATLPKHINLHVPDREEYDFMYSAIYGGRVVAKNGAYEEDIIYADVVSLYPSTMKLLEHPHGKMVPVKSINWNKIGIYEVFLTSKRRPERYSEFVPFRESSVSNRKGGLSYHWRPQWQGTYHTYDLLIAREEGYNIECIRGMEWDKGKLFGTFVDKLFKMKAHPPCQCAVKCADKCVESGPIRMVAKIALNGGGYGKFVQKPIDTDLYVVQKGVVHGAFERMEKNSEGMVVKARHVINMPKFYPLNDAWDKMVIEDPEALPQYPTQVGISILSGSRYRLYNLCKQFPGMEVIYSDTDSIFVRKSTIDWELFKSKCGTELGQLDDTIDSTPHGTIGRMYIAGPKMYAYEYHNQQGIPQQTVHCKGIRNKDLDMRHFEWLCKDVDYKIKYNMIIMAKNIVDIRTLNIDKEIKQT